MKPEPIRHRQNEQLEVLLPAAFSHGFDYVVELPMELNEGDIVSVPFGRGQSLGVVWGSGEAKLAPDKIKSIAQHQDNFPALSKPFREFIKWVAWYNCAPVGAVLKMVLPIKDIAKTGRIELDTAINEKYMALAELSPVQKEAVQKLYGQIGSGFSVSVLDGVTGSGKTEVYFDAIASVLSGQQAVDSKQQKEERSVDSKSHHPAEGGKLLQSQEALQGTNNKGGQQADPAMSPPHGESQQAETGGNQILVLLPEIALSVQWLERFEKRFGFTPVIWNSEVTPARKRASWQAIAKGDARVIVGARSALFLPYKNLSMIIVDEEHDGSYKQEDGVIYHARDMAVARGRFEKLPVILVSATPSLETYQNMQTGKYTEISLPLRHNDASLPDIELVDMKNEETERGAFVSKPLRDALESTIKGGHQAMLFLNRRGYAPLVLCRSCGYRFECEECSAWLVAHKNKPRLACHHCGFSQPMPSSCPDCGAEDNLHACGPGVERVLEEVAEFMPEAKVAVMASDQLASHKELRETIEDMQNGKIDILIGTQMIAKGHHFAGLAMVGVVDADLGLGGGDLRASEKTYQLLHQLSGRAGRESIKGKVYLQSFLPEHPVMKALLSGERDAFMQAELAARENAGMPPFSRLAAIIVEGAKEDVVRNTARLIAASFTNFDVSSDIELLGPAPAPLFMLRGKYRYRLLVKAPRNINVPELIDGLLNNCKIPSSVRVKTDIDPVSFL